MSRRSNLVHVSLIAGLIVAGCSDDTLLEPSANFHVVPQIGLAKRFVAPLSGAAEVPPVDARGRGVGHFLLSRDGTTLHFMLSVFNIENVTQAHIHLGARDENGPVVAFLFGFVEGGVTLNGLLSMGTITDDDIFAREGFDGTLASLVQRMRRGETYINTHTVAIPAGEIRGQIRPVRKHDRRR